MREGATVYAWTTQPSATVYAWISRPIHRLAVHNYAPSLFNTLSTLSDAQRTAAQCFLSHAAHLSGSAND
jgi:hypothetical protein